MPEDTTVSRPPRHAIDPGARWPRWIRDVVPAVQRYVEDRLSDPSAGVAAATRVSLRELQKPFERRGETSPTGCVSGGARPDRAGFVVQPTVFADADDDMTIAREEISGPVGTVIPSDDPEEAVRIASTTTYGPAVTIWTKDVTAAHSLPAQARAGAVWVDCWAAIDAALPRDGMKSSGIGRELGWSGILANTEEKVRTVVLRRRSPSTERSTPCPSPPRCRWSARPPAPTRPPPWSSTTRARARSP